VQLNPDPSSPLYSLVMRGCLPFHGDEEISSEIADLCGSCFSKNEIVGPFSFKHFRSLFGAIYLCLKVVG
jgi:hypothetical protein